MSMINDILTTFKDRLLDLTKRNRMLNTNFQARNRQTFRFIDEVPDQLYKKLKTSSMYFIPLKNNTQEPIDEKSDEFIDRLEISLVSDDIYLKEIKKIEENNNYDDINQENENALRRLKDRIRTELNMPTRSEKNINLKELAIKNNLSPDYELPSSSSQNSSKHSDNKIQTLMLEKTLNSMMSNINNISKSALKESGVKTLYVCFGFLQWRESEASDINLHSPILMLPVDLSADKKKSKLLISSTGDEIIINQTLNEKLKKDFNIQLPNLGISEDEETEFSIMKYLDSVKKIISNTDWKIKNWASFGVYKSQSMPIYLDIQNIIKLGLGNSGLLKSIIDGKDYNEQSNDSIEAYELDSNEISKLIPSLVTDADESQYSAVVDSIKGKDMVLKGPPGTGKSQTITNIISAFLSKGKKVLFIAEKQAALDVVRNNLVSSGLGDYLFEVFSIKSNKKVVMESLAKRLEMNKPKSKTLEYTHMIEQYKKIKNTLNEHASLLNAPYRDWGKSIHEVIWSNENKHYDIPKELKLNIDKIPKTYLGMLDNINKLSFIKNEYKEIFKNKNDTCPFLKINVVLSKPREFEEFDKNVTELNQKIHIFDKNTKKQNQILLKYPHILFSTNIAIRNYYQTQKDKADESDLWSMIKLSTNKSIRDEVEPLFKNIQDRKEKIKKYTLSEDNIKKIFQLDLLDYSENLKRKIRDIIPIIKNTWFLSFLSSKWRDAMQYYKGIVKDSERKNNSQEVASDLVGLLSFLQTKQTALNEIDRLQSNIQLRINLIDKNCPEISIKNLIDDFDVDKFLTIYNSCTGLSDDIVDIWMKDPSQIVSYYDYGIEKNTLESDLALFITSLDIDTKDNHFDLIKSFASTKVKIQDFMYYQKSVKDINDKNLLSFYTSFVEHVSKENQSMSIDDIEDVYKFCVTNVQLTDIYDNYEVNKFTSGIISNKRKELKDIDPKISQTTQDIIKAYLYNHNAPLGKRSGRVSEKTDLGLIEHVSNKTNSRTSIRDLMNRAIDAIIELKPCTLMSPLTVAQTLPLRPIYDLVVIDEASQMKSELAIGALARSHQAIIVGDQNQLPPTRVFESQTSEDNDDDDINDESILDLAIKSLPSRNLLYHYRSRHESLIKFSNNEFYHNLMIPVTASPKKEDRGIKHIYLKNARYVVSKGGVGGGINPLEAEKVIHEVFDIMKNRPNESVGIATMNIKQKEYLSNLFDRMSAKDNDILEYVQKWDEQDDGLKEFFIKNIENVQGDERDIIIVSTVFGPHSDSPEVYQRFGINNQFGWRRLNVLFTRAKNQMIIVTSLKSSQVKVGDESGKSIKIFKKYLEYIEQNELTLGKPSGEPIDNAFQQWAIDQVNSHPDGGFDAEWEVGVSGYRIDIGIKHESFEQYILAVETDGATYHSSKYARDRDYNRQKILEGHGWVFHRIWSTDWIRDPVAESKKLHIAMSNRLKEMKLSS